MNSLLIAGQTDVGQRRTSNQDTFICSTIWSPSSALLVVIDGVGGYAGGEQAAAIARQSIEKYMASPNGDPLSMLREAVVFANNQINQQRQQDNQLSQMCCVLTAALADSQSDTLYFVHVGDTRLYRYRQATLEKLTHDHSLVGAREDANELTEAEAMSHPRRNEIFREVGLTEHRVDDPDFLEWGTTDFLPGDQLLLCSDGLTDMITQAQIRSVLDQSVPLEKRTAQLIRLANEEGGKDNITVVLAAYPGSTDAPVKAAPAAVAKPAVDPQPAQPVAPVRSSAPKPKASRSLGGIWIGLVLLLGVFIAGIVWYNKPAEVTQREKPTTEPIEPTTVGPEATPLDSALQTAYRSPLRQLKLTLDTVRLAEPLLLTDSLQSLIGTDRSTVFIPVDSTRAGVALQITRTGSVEIGNVVFSGFKTGIEMVSGTKIQLSNVSFRGVDEPVKAVVRQDTLRNAVIMVTVQNQSDSPKSTRP